MKKKNKVLLTSMATIAMCASLVAGGTYALFTSESAVNIAVTSATVSVVATVDENSVETKQLYDTEYTQGATNMYEGVATFDDYGLTLEKLVPGDGIKFNIVVANESNVTVQYRTIISCENDDGLFAGLNITVGDNENYSGVTLVSDWAELAVDAEDAIVPVSIELPDTGDNQYDNQFQGKSCKISYKVEAVQGNAEVENPEDDTIYVYNANDLKALSGKYLVSNNGKAEIQNVELMNDVDLNGAEFKEIGVAYGDTLNFNGNGYAISNMKLATGKHNGMTNVGMFYVDSSATLNVENLTLVAPVVEDAIDKYATGAAAVVGYANGVVNLTNVDVENANVNNTFGNAAIYVGYGVNAINLTDCDIIGADTTVSGEVEDGVVRADKTGAFVGTANQTSCVATLTNCTNDSSYNMAGRVINGATMTVDGAYYVTTADAFKALMAGSESEVNIILADGKYDNVLSASNKTITVVGENENGAEIALTKALNTAEDHLGLGGCTVTLENVKATFEDGAYYAAYINNPTLTYKNCTIIGQQYIYGNVSFINCVFDNDDDAAISGFRYSYIYDGDVVVDNCDFYTQGHGLIMFSDNGGAGAQTLTVKNSRFHGGNGRKAGAVANQNTAAIEIDGSCGANYTLILEGENTFDGGFSGLWRIKAMKDGVKTTVNNVEYTGATSDVYLDGVRYTKNAESNVALYHTYYVADGLVKDADGVYYITSAKGFDAMRSMVEGEEAYEKDGTWVLNTDIDLNGIDWTPIAGFHGTFDGNDKTISNMNASFLAENDKGTADFGVECIIKDVTFDKANITGTEGVGVVVSNAYGVTIENVKVTDSTVIGTKYVGGIVGVVNKGISTITGCTVTNSTIKADGEDANGKVGGIVGFLSVGKATGNTVTGCTISGPECVGGIAGRGGSGDGSATIYGNTVSGNTVTGTDTATVGEQIGDKLNVKETE